jgi:uncharacterized OB-fold protein
MSDDPFDDPTTEPFWAAARQGRFLLQRCDQCGRHQFYPRPFCLACEAKGPSWVDAQGRAFVYAVTQVLRQISPDVPAPYQVAIVELAEGPRLLTHIVGREVQIGESVRLAWRQRDKLPPLPIFEAL